MKSREECVPYERHCGSKATAPGTYVPYFLKPFSLDHLQDLFMAHGRIRVFLQNLR